MSIHITFKVNDKKKPGIVSGLDCRYKIFISFKKKSTSTWLPLTLHYM